MSYLTTYIVEIPKTSIKDISGFNNTLAEDYMFSFTTSGNVSSVYGDVNGDRNIDVGDAILVLRHIE